jgi:hypothetical protein
MTLLELPNNSQDQTMQERRENVSYLLIQGFTEVEIAKKLGVSRETIVRDVRCLKSLANPWIDDLAKNGFPFEYRLTMDKLKENERGYRKMLQKPDLTVTEELRIRKALDDNICQQFQLLGEGPTLQSLNKIVRAHDNIKRELN